MRTRRVVVGVDGSPGAADAVAWAADEAHRRCMGLLITHVGDVPDLAALSVDTAAAVDADLDRFSQHLLAKAIAVATARQATIEIIAAHVRGRVVERLIELGAQAELLVVGRRGAHGCPGTLLGNVSHRVAAYGQCPVTVVPPGRLAANGTGDVVVGVSSSRSAMYALAAAFQQAQRQHARLIAIRAWGELDWAQSVGTYRPDTAERWRLASQDLLDACVGRVARQFPSVPFETRLVRGRVKDALLDQVDAEDTLLIGGHDTVIPRMSRLGWSALQLLAQAPCPVQIGGWPAPDSPDRQPALAAVKIGGAACVS